MRRKLFIFLLTATALFLVLAGAAWVLLNNETFLKRQLSEIVLRQTGRVLTVAGPLRLTLGATTILDAQQLRFGSAPWDPEPHMARAGHFALSLDLRSVFSAQTVIHHLQLADCELAWRVNAGGDSNWELLQARSEDGQDEAQPAGLPRYRLERVQIDRCQLSHETPERLGTLVVELNQLALQLVEEGAYRAQLQGEVDEIPLSLDGGFGPVQSLWQGGPFSYELDLRLGEISLSGSGDLADARAGSGANISLRFSGPEFASVTDYLALPPFSTDAFDFSLQLATVGEMTKVDLDGDLGSFELSAEGEVDRLVRPGKGQLRLSAAGPNLKALGELFDLEGLAAESFTVTLAATIDHGQLELEPFVLASAEDRLEIRGVLGEWPGLKNSSLEFSTRAGEIGRWAEVFGRTGLQGGEVSAAGRLGSDAAGLVTVRAKVEHRNSRLGIDGSLGVAPEIYEPELDFTFDSADLSQLAALLNMRHLPAVPASASGHISEGEPGFFLKGMSVTLAESQARLDGRLVPSARFAGSDFTLQLDLPSAASFGHLFDAENFPDLPLVAQMRVVPEGQGLAFQIIDGRLGGIAVSFKGHMADVRTPRVLSADVNLHMNSLKQLAFLAPDKPWLDLPLAATGIVDYRPGNLGFSAMHIALGQTEANIEAAIPLADGHSGSTIRFDGRGKDLGELFPAWEMKNLARDFSASGIWTKNTGAETLADVRLGWGATRVELAGSVDHVLSPGRLDLQVQFLLPDASVFNEPYDWVLPDKPFSARFSMAGSPEDLNLAGLSAQLGDSSAKGKLRLEWGAPPRLSGTLDAEAINLSHWLVPKKDQIPVSRGKSPAKSTRVFDDSPVRGLGKKTLELDLEVRAAQSSLGNAVIEDIRFGILYSNEALHLDRVQARDRTGQEIAGAFSMNVSGPVPQMDLVLKGNGIRLGLASFKGQDPSTFPLTEVDLSLHGKGATRHELVSSLDGRLRVYQGPGLVAYSGMEFMFTDVLTQLIKTLNPFSKTAQFEQLDCAVFAADIVSGTATFEPIVIRLKEVTIQSQGLIDLETEGIDLNFSSRARKGIGLNPGLLINPFIKVGGTLATPAIELDPAGAVVKGGAVVATAGIPLLAKSLSDRLLGSDPCAAAREKLEGAGNQTR